jgi:hypothetical protein
VKKFLTISLIIGGLWAQQKPDPLALTQTEIIHVLELGFAISQNQLQTYQLLDSFTKSTKKVHEDLLQRIFDLKGQLGILEEQYREAYIGIQKNHNCDGCQWNDHYVLVHPKGSK